MLYDDDFSRLHLQDGNDDGMSDGDDTEGEDEAGEDEDSEDGEENM